MDLSMNKKFILKSYNSKTGDYDDTGVYEPFFGTVPFIEGKEYIFNTLDMKDKIFILENVDRSPNQQGNYAVVYGRIENKK